jgi:carbon monoxide dehydrogenase subunit G
VSFFHLGISFLSFCPSRRATKVSFNVRTALVRTEHGPAAIAAVAAERILPPADPAIAVCRKIQDFHIQMSDQGLISVRESFAVPVDAASVWRALHDPLVAECVPGVTLTSVKEDGLHQGTIRVKFGPTRVEFKGQARVSYDEEARVCTISSRGRDQRGTSNARAQGRILVSGTDSTTVSVEGGFHVSGALSAFARTGGIYVARELFAEFSANLAARVQAPSAAGPVQPERPRGDSIEAGALTWRIVRGWVARLFGYGAA